MVKKKKGKKKSRASVKLRASQQLGENNPSCKLTDEQVLEARKLHSPFSRKFGAAALARKYGVCVSTMHNILDGQSWKHLK